MGTAISRSYIMSWGTPGNGAIRLEFKGAEGFRRAYDLAVADAEIFGGLFEVDLWDVELPMDRPMMMQVLMGHPTRSRVLVHIDGVGHYAIGGLPVGDDEKLRFERPGGTYAVEPETMTMTPAQAREILAGFVLTGRASTRVIWAELSMD
ncbi:hypothetical protein AB1046_23615 [Promicromonospora sp. Populi]|uniref:hypothetical protein n=1 Tax=Promicromonospora sp. Populi TaxID=3239420 RepID=UPI0034E19490